MKRLSKAAYAELSGGQKAAYTKAINKQTAAKAGTSTVATKKAPAKKTVNPLAKKVATPVAAPRTARSTSGTKEY